MPFSPKEDYNKDVDGKACFPWNWGHVCGFAASHGLLPDGYAHVCAWCAYRFHHLLPHKEQDCLKKKKYLDKKTASETQSAPPVSVTFGNEHVEFPVVSNPVTSSSLLVSSCNTHASSTPDPVSEPPPMCTPQCTHPDLVAPPPTMLVNKPDQLTGSVAHASHTATAPSVLHNSDIADTLSCGDTCVVLPVTPVLFDWFDVTVELELSG